MLPKVSHPPALPHCPVHAIREELRSMLVHPAITPERRRQAEPFLAQCLDEAKLTRWQQLILQECAKWEDKVLATEETQASAICYS